MGSEQGFQQQVEGFMEAQRESELQESADATRLRQDLSAALAVPIDCLLGRVPGILKPVDDHVLFPFSPFWSKGNKRWMRVSSFYALSRVSYKFRRVLEDKVLNLHVMPYISPFDAFKIHSLIHNPGRILCHYDVDDDGQKLPVEGRSGVLVVSDPDAPADESAAAQLKFTVMNYGLLWAKASEYLIFVGTMDPAKQLTAQLDDYLQKLLEDPITANAINGPNHITNLEEACEQSKRELLLSLRNDGIDPHNTILATDAELHEELYDLGYDPCYPNDRTNNEMKDLTKNAVEAYLVQLEGHRVHRVQEARWNVLMAEGKYDVEARRSEAVKQFSDALQTCKNQLVDAVNKVNVAASRPSLIGVIQREARAM